AAVQPPGLRAGTPSGVGHASADLLRPLRHGSLRGPDLRRVVLEAGVAEPVPERIQRRPRHVDVLAAERVVLRRRAPGVAAREVDRHLADVARHRHRLLARRIDVSQQYSVEGVTALARGYTRISEQRD